MKRISLWSVLFLFVLVSISAAGQPILDPVGMRVTVVPDQINPLKADIVIRWTENSPAGLVEVNAPLGLEVVASDSAMNFVSVDHKIRAEFLGLEKGTLHEFQLDLTHVNPGESVLVCTERIRGPQRWQLVTLVKRTEVGFETEASRGFRITHIAAGSTADLETNDPRIAVTDGAKGSFLVESLNKRIDILDTEFEENFSDIAIADGPTNCAASSPTWPALGVFSINSAPAAAVSTGITVHVTIIHPVMADLEVAAFYSATNPGGPGRFLHRQSAGVNMDQDFDHDVFGHALEGVGQSVNAFYSIGARDCLAGNTGLGLPAR